MQTILRRRYSGVYLPLALAVQWLFFSSTINRGRGTCGVLCLNSLRVTMRASIIRGFVFSGFFPVFVRSFCCYDTCALRHALRQAAQPKRFSFMVLIVLLILMSMLYRIAGYVVPAPRITLSNNKMTQQQYLGKPTVTIFLFFDGTRWYDILGIYVWLGDERSHTLDKLSSNSTWSRSVGGLLELYSFSAKVDCSLSVQRLIDSSCISRIWSI